MEIMGEWRQGRHAAALSSQCVHRNIAHSVPEMAFAGLKGALGWGVGGAAALAADTLLGPRLSFRGGPRAYYDTHGCRID